ncbi:uncharacterized protein LOC131212520 [Anopheles bellator]|uniref:uncharacterized protein LOC131212520 n=1 Tax=Anopheles bellator TaxID=139047 RepID=UPI002647E903|nr:uncharacterized protein LOC131212520 [Anopheles bellator]
MASFPLLIGITVLCVATTIVSGARGKTPVVPDVASTSFTESEHCSKDQYRIRVRDPNRHISTRLLRYFTFGGILQGIHEETQIPRAELVLGGASQYQDQSSQLGPKYHAAHVIRVGSIDKRLKQKNKDLFKALTNYVGHTQNVISLANVWHGC